MRTKHLMPFGAEVRPSGVQFRLWAPAARTVELLLYERGLAHAIPMRAIGDGWFAQFAEAAHAGSEYRFRIDGKTEVCDPAARRQAQGVRGPSVVVDPTQWEWIDDAWEGRPWEQAVIYELHVGTFTPQGTFAGVKRKLRYLRDLGVTAVELMPVADFPGARGWGYDVVLPFAPKMQYGSPEELKDLVQSAHALGIMVFLDVVYNHFGPEGNLLAVYAPQFFTSRHQTAWGAAINFDELPHARAVRDFIIHNALYWLEEFRFDGLRLDAAHAIADDSAVHILEELALAVRSGPGGSRHIHLVLENDANQPRWLIRDALSAPVLYTAQWNDDIHHAMHTIATGEDDGYYADYAGQSLRLLGRCLAEGFAYQGEPSIHRHGHRRGAPSANLPPSAFVAFLQNHDQVGNRAFGERIGTLCGDAARAALTAIVLLGPQTPLLFMGQEWDAREPFLYFCDFDPPLANQVRAGRENEFARFAQFAAPDTRIHIPDPNAETTFDSSRLSWLARKSSNGRKWLALHRSLLALRAQRIVPVLRTLISGGVFTCFGSFGLDVAWYTSDGRKLRLLANLGAVPTDTPDYDPSSLIYATARMPQDGHFPAWFTAWFLEGERNDARR